LRVACSLNSILQRRAMETRNPHSSRRSQTKAEHATRFGP
jgi:hypothetical protein